jgi:hypothetical protein
VTETFSVEKKKCAQRYGKRRKPSNSGALGDGRPENARLAGIE